MIAYRLLIVFLLMVFGLLQWQLWVGQGSLTHVQSLEETITVMEEENDQSRQRNTEMLAEIKDLKNGLGAVEGIARHELGLIKQDETFLLVVDDVDEPDADQKADSY